MKRKNILKIVFKNIFASKNLFRKTFSLFFNFAQLLFHFYQNDKAQSLHQSNQCSLGIEKTKKKSIYAEKLLLTNILNGNN